MRDIKGFLVTLFIFISLILAALTVMADAEGRLALSARSSVLYSPQTDTFIFESDPDERLPMASTTKIMTALIAIETLDPDEMISVADEAVGIEGSSIYLKHGDKLTARDLIYSVMLRSANDAAAALAIHIAGSTESFAELMNERAMRIGLTDTLFNNPHGLDHSEHYTTAHDLALIASEAIKNPIFKSVCSTYKYSFYIGDALRTVVNHNKLLKQYDGAFGVKTGYTKKCGRCLVSAAEKDGVTLIAVTLNAPDDWRDHTSLLDYGFSRLKAVKLSSICDINYKCSVLGGEKDHILAGCDDENIVGYENDSFTCSTELPRYIARRIDEGEALGRIFVYKNNELYKTIELKALESVSTKKQKKFSLFQEKD